MSKQPISEQFLSVGNLKPKLEWFFKLKLKPKFFLLNWALDGVCGTSSAGCCRRIEIRSTWIATYVKGVHPDFFTAYRMEEDKFNGKPHYTTADGRYALSYASDCDYWLLQGYMVKIVIPRLRDLNLMTKTQNLAT